MARLPHIPDIRKSKKQAVGTAALLLGAAGLALYIVGVKRRHRLDDGRTAGPADDEHVPPERRSHSGTAAAD